MLAHAEFHILKMVRSNCGINDLELTIFLKTSGLFTVPDLRVRSRGFNNATGRLGSGHHVLKYHGLGRVGSKGLEISQVGSG